jgi:hypothetical protein
MSCTNCKARLAGERLQGPGINFGVEAQNVDLGGTLVMVIE